MSCQLKFTVEVTQGDNWQIVISEACRFVKKRSHSRSRCHGNARIGHSSHLFTSTLQCKNSDTWQSPKRIPVGRHFGNSKWDAYKWCTATSHGRVVKRGTRFTRHIAFSTVTKPQFVSLSFPEQQEEQEKNTPFWEIRAFPVTFQKNAYFSRFPAIVQSAFISSALVLAFPGHRKQEKPTEPGWITWWTKNVGRIDEEKKRAQ